jgi:hypothetical protein
MPASRRPDTLTIIAVTVMAAAITDVLHEAIGHGGACLLSGLHAIALSTVHFECSFDSRLVSAGGTLINIIAGGLALLALRVAHAPRWKLFFWLLLTFNWLDAGGYFLFSGIGNIGDWAAVISGLQPVWAWRAGLTLLGVVCYLLVVWIVLRELQPMLSPDQAERLRRARRLLLIPYFTHGILLTVAGLLNPVGMLLVVISAMAASFGGCSAMLWMGSLLRGSMIPGPSREGPPVERSIPWIVVSAITAAMFVFVLGRGLHF